MPASVNSFLDAATDAVARAIANFQREARLEKDVRDAEYRARLAELDALRVSVAALETECREKLASLKNGEPGRDGANGLDGADGKDGANGKDGRDGEPGKDGRDGIDGRDGVDGKDGINGSDGKDGIDGRNGDHGRDGVDGKDGKDGIDGQNGTDGRDGADGKDGEHGRDGLDGKDGRDADPEAMRSVIAEAVAALPPAQDGRDADMDAIEARISEIAQTALATVSEAVAAIRVPEDGKSVTLDDVAPMIAESVRVEVATIETPKDGIGVSEAKINDDGDLIITLSSGEPINAGRALGWDGADIDWDDVRAHLTEMFDAWPKPVDGKDGRDGKLPIVKPWQDAVHYEGDVVTSDGRLYQALRDTGKAPGHDDWLCIADRGKDGIDGNTFSVRGTWIEGEDYRNLDVVAINGASFVAKQDAPGPCPGEGWQMIAAQGKRGHPGERGVGLKGDRGSPGEPVVAGDVSDDGVLTLTNGDGSQVSIDLYPLLSKLK
jgi:hypothetical protein